MIRAVRGGGHLFRLILCYKTMEKGVVDCFTQKGADLFVHLEENPSLSAIKQQKRFLFFFMMPLLFEHTR